MNFNRIFAGLNIDSPLATPDALNFIPQTWPPHSDFPIVIDAKGKIVSRYGDQTWNLTPWARRVTSINFGDGPSRKNAPRISTENADIFRMLVAWWIYGPRSIRKTSTLVRLYEIFRPVFVFCSEQGILASDLVRYPNIAARLTEVIWESSSSLLIKYMHDAWENRKILSFFLLDADGIKKLAASLPKHEKSQTPYIPPRIWLYQVSRLKACLDDFIIHKEKIQRCFEFCLDAYAKNAGSLTEAFTKKLPTTHLPFYSDHIGLTGSRSGLTFHGPFSRTAERFGIDLLLKRWIATPDIQGPAALSSYLNLVTQVGKAYILNFSLMRSEEALSLRLNALTTEYDDVSGENICILRGVTTKTVEDDDARWITSPSVAVAVEAMSAISSLRMIAAAANPNVTTLEQDLVNPYLIVRSYEPWRRRSEHITVNQDIRPSTQTYGSLYARYPKLFDQTELSIQKVDLQIARLINPTLNPENFDVGKIWPLAWHQLRRTGVVNMTASGLVSDSSLQYQLKHLTRAMTRYYGQGYYHLNLNLNGELRSEYVRTMYEMVAHDFNLLQSKDFVSPHGSKRKSQILNLISERDIKTLSGAARSGSIAFRRTIFGACTNPNPCPFGGIDNVSRCGGGDGKPPCEDALFDRKKIFLIQKLGELISTRLIEAPEDSPLYESLKAQHRAVEITLNALTTK
ncbi:hypothetical protein ACIGJK_05920 [Pseudomonas iridis]|uniref:hypothetical protein n=1 Tax=Pseudomonas iridis TaxID=2710587 RepID=UPI0037C7B1B7